MVFKKLFEDSNRTGQEFIEQSVGSRSASCLDYEVSSRPVALHHPLTRLLAGKDIFAIFSQFWVIFKNFEQFQTDFGSFRPILAYLHHF